MVADLHEPRRPRNLTAAEMSAQADSQSANVPNKRASVDFSRTLRRLRSIESSSIAAFITNFLWRWPAALWTRFWALAQNSGLRWLVFAPWLIVIIAPVALEILQDIASWAPPESSSGLESLPLLSVVRPTIVTLILSFDSAILHITTIPEALLWWPLLICAFAYIGTGPIHIMAAGDQTPALDSHGSAAWGTLKEATAAGHLSLEGEQGGLMLGRMLDLPHAKAKLDPRYRVQERHVVTIASTGAGKAVGGAIPNLLEYPGSTFSVDPKTELYKITGHARLQKGFKVARIDPFGCTGKPSHSVNWLDGIDPADKSCVAEAAQLAEALVVRRNSDDSHWDTQAAYLLQGLILHVATLPKHMRHIGTVRAFLTQAQQQFCSTLTTLQDDKRGCGVVAKMANTFLAKADREQSGVLSTAQGHTAFLDDPQILATVERSDFQWEKLKSEKMSVYIIVPPEKLNAYNRYVRATVSLALGAMTKHARRPAHPVLFLLDEFAQLGRMTVVENTMPILRSYGALLWLFVQDLSQLRAVYSKWESFLGNTCWQVFGIQDQGTARYFSEALGNKTIRVQTAGTSTNVGSGRGSHSQSRNESYAARPLMTPDELRGLSLDRIVVIQRAERPMLLRSLSYLTDPESAGRAQRNPDA